VRLQGSAATDCITLLEGRRNRARRTVRPKGLKIVLTGAKVAKSQRTVVLSRNVALTNLLSRISRLWDARFSFRLS